MENKLLIYIVSYERMSYTQGTIECLHKTKPQNSQIIVCDNGSTDGTREWLEENQEKYNLGLLFPEENLRVGGAWTLLTNYYNEKEFDYTLQEFFFHNTSLNSLLSVAYFRHFLFL